MRQFLVLLCCCLLVPTLLAAADVLPQSPKPEDDPVAVAGRRFDAMTQLPAGTGKELTAIACSRCHELGGLKAYKGYWSREQWLAMVESMVKNGAALDAAQTQVVTDYLNDNYGRQSR